MTELTLLVECREVVLGLATRFVERLAHPEEAQTVVAREQTGGARRPRPLVRVRDNTYAAWDLASMLGLSPVAQAWVLLRVPWAGRKLPLALRTGTCLVVRELAELTPLPPGMFTLRALGLHAAFATERMTRSGPRAVGLYLDVARLWADGELAASAAALDGAARP
jgi:hypothetical protein